MRKEQKATHETIIEGFPCLTCGETHFYALFPALDFDSGKESFQLIACKSCNLVRTEPVLINEELINYYSLPYYGSGKEKFVNLAEMLTNFFNALRARSILSHLSNSPGLSEGLHPRILDIGCGRGNLLKALKQLGCDCYGLERSEFPIDDRSPDVNIYREKLEDIFFSEGFFDAVVIWHVLEHIDDPISMMQETARILRPGGVLAIAVPNFGSFQAGIFRENWFHLDLPRHVHHFTTDVLLGYLKDNRFDIIHKHTFSIEQNLFGFIQSLFNKIAPFAKPNQFYSLLKKRNNSFSIFNFLMWAIFAVLVFPFALLEYFISGLLGKGATFIVYAKKC